MISLLLMKHRQTYVKNSFLSSAQLHISDAIARDSHLYSAVPWAGLKKDRNMVIRENCDNAWSLQTFQKAQLARALINQYKSYSTVYFVHRMQVNRIKISLSIECKKTNWQLSSYCKNILSSLSVDMTNIKAYIQKYEHWHIRIKIE